MDNRNDLHWRADSLRGFTPQCASLPWWLAAFGLRSTWEQRFGRYLCLSFSEQTGVCHNELWMFFIPMFKNNLFFFPFAATSTWHPWKIACVFSLIQFWRHPHESHVETPPIVSTGCGLAPCQSWCSTVKISGEASAKRNCRSRLCSDPWPFPDASWQISPTYRVRAAAEFFWKCGFCTALLTPRLLTEETGVDEHRWRVKRTTELSADYWVKWKPSVNSGYDWLCPAPFGCKVVCVWGGVP